MFEKDETFMIELLEVKTPGAKLGRLKRSVVTIVSDDGKSFSPKVLHPFHFILLIAPHEITPL